MVDFDDNGIFPGHPKWFIPDSERKIITSAAVVNANEFVFAMILDGETYSTADAYSRFYRFRNGRWRCVEVELSIMDMLVTERLLEPPDELVVLGSDGEVWFVGPNTRLEQIPDPRSKRYRGGTNILRRFEDTFFAAGLGGQCYRGHQGIWVHDDLGMLDFAPTFPRMRPGDVGQPADIADLITLTNGDQYACGTLAIARPALLWRSRGVGAWQWLGSGVDDPYYDQMSFRGMLADDQGMVWITTNKGVLFKGNAAQGFRPATERARSATDPSDILRLNQIMYYRGAIIAQSNEGPHRLRKDGGWEALPKLPPKEGEVRARPQSAGGRLEAYGDVLWSMSRNAARFDGQTWTRFPMPSITPP